jgi:hypothetical protein
MKLQFDKGVALLTIARDVVAIHLNKAAASASKNLKPIV